ncbi:MAG: alanine racemase [Candidatus Aphodosoma sp.]
MNQARYEVEAGINNCLIIRDSHSSDLTSLTKHALSFLEQQSANQDLRRTLIVSDIDGNDLANEMFYSNIQRAINSGNLRRIIFIGPELTANATMFAIGEKYFFKTTQQLLYSDVMSTFDHEAILLKIAPEFEPERILNHLQLQAHDTVMETNFDALFHNVDYFRSKLRPETKLMCMVKASAYGSGSVEVSQALQFYGCDYLAVAFANEGVELRKAGIALPILVLDPMAPALHQLFQNELEPEVGSFQFLQTVMDEARHHGLKHYPIHIKLDTGMHRAGFDTEDIPLLADILRNQDLVDVRSIFSHLAAADDITPEMDTFTRRQATLFDKNSGYLQESLPYPILRHILNTAGIERFPEYQFDMVRLGIGLWGVNCCNEDRLRNVCSLYTRIMQIKTVHAGETVGYNRRGTVEQDKQIALLPIGYADGMDRRLGNGRGSVFVNGRQVPIIGNICMDLMMVDITGIDANVGDKAMIFDDRQGLSEIARQLGTIPYEVLTSIAPRVRRVYYRN